MVLVVLVAMSVPWLRMSTLVDAGQLDVSRAMVAGWESVEKREVPDDAATPTGVGGAMGVPRNLAGVEAARLTVDQVRVLAARDAFLKNAVDSLTGDPTLEDYQASSWIGTQREYRYAKAVRAGFGAEDAGTLRGVILLDRRSVEAAALLLVNSGYLLSAGMFVMAIAIVLFYFIVHKLVLSPVHALRVTAERVREGDLAIRSEIRTGDEFEELADTFNLMLTDLSGTQDQLRAINRALDLKLTELSEMNTTLFEAAKIKGDFLANVSHELRTPLNAIIGFADLLVEGARAEAAGLTEVPPGVARRLRYLENIHTAAKGLLEMINDLLEMAKIESGRLDLHVERMNVHNVCEGLLGLISPLADKKGLPLKLEVADDLPLIETDVKKFQQIIFNFLSNAVKFTESPAKSGQAEQVTLRAEKLSGSVPGGGVDERIRVSVIDTGPGIPPEQHEKVFEKFYQLSRGHTREHAGTGLGLAICKELAAILQGEIQLVSETGGGGRGSMFSLIIPLKVDPEESAVRRLEHTFRGSLAGRRTWA